MTTTKEGPPFERRLLTAETQGSGAATEAKTADSTQRREERREKSRRRKRQGNDCQRNRSYSPDNHCLDISSGLPRASATESQCEKLTRRERFSKAAARKNAEILPRAFPLRSSRLCGF